LLLHGQYKKIKFVLTKNSLFRISNSLRLFVSAFLTFSFLRRHLSTSITFIGYRVTSRLVSHYGFISANFAVTLLLLLLLRAALGPR
jgi:hypothetical protein